MTPGPTDAEPVDDAPSGEQVERVITAIGGLRSEVGDLKTSADNDRIERERENAKRDTRIRWSRRATAGAVIVALLALLLVYEVRSTQKDIKHAVCREAESFTNSLIRISPPPTSDEERVRQQGRINTFKTNLERDLDLGCNLHLIDAPPVATTTVPTETTVPAN